MQNIDQGALRIINQFNTKNNKILRSMGTLIQKPLRFFFTFLLRFV